MRSILHSCITQLLKEEASPRMEDVECLCKLMTTVGGQLDSTKKPELVQAMKVYFDRMQRLRENQKLDNRIRFMIQDVIDLRQNRWIPRVKKEGPKKIQDIHREANQELAAQQARDMDERRRGGGGNRGPPPPPTRSDYNRMLGKDDMPSRALQMQRAPSSEMQFRPGGAFGRGRDRNQGGHMQPRGGPPAPAAAAPAPERVVTPPPRAAPAMSLEDLKSSVNDLVEAFHATSPPSNEALLEGLAGMRTKGGDMGRVLPFLLVAALNHRGIDVAERLPPVVPALTAALEKGAEGGLTAAEFEAGAIQLAKEMHGLADDMPKAPKLLGPFFAGFIASGVTTLNAVLGTVLDVEPLPGGGLLVWGVEVLGSNPACNATCFCGLLFRCFCSPGICWLSRHGHRVGCGALMLCCVCVWSQVTTRRVRRTLTLPLWPPAARTTCCSA